MKESSLLTIEITTPCKPSFEQMMELENEMNDAASQNEDVDGHEIGTDGFAIFIISNDPKSTLARIIGKLDNKPYKNQTKVYCRSVDSEVNTLLWPYLMGAMKYGNKL